MHAPYWLSDIFIEEDMKVFLSRLENFDHDAFATFKSVYPSITAGSEFNPLFATDIDTIFADVAKELTKYGYNGIYIVYKILVIKVFKCIDCF